LPAVNPAAPARLLTGNVVARANRLFPNSPLGRYGWPSGGE
jgi:hypothetical protein